MGLFGPKKSAEQKNYEKAFKDVNAFFSFKAKNVPALVDACRSYPDQWEGTFTLGLCSDAGISLPYDPEKALEYYRKAGQYIQAKASPAEKEWYNSFMSYYRYYSYGNAFLNLPERARSIRRLGVAALASYTDYPYKELTEESAYNFPISWYDFFNAVPHKNIKIFGKNDLEDVCINSAVSAAYIINGGSADQQERMKKCTSYIKEANSYSSSLDKLLEKSRKEKKNIEECMEGISEDCILRGYYFLLLGLAFFLIKPCPYDFMSIEEKSGKESQEIGLQYLCNAVLYGNTCALEVLVEMAHDSRYRTMIARNFKVSASSLGEILVENFYSPRNAKAGFYRNAFAFDSAEDRETFESKLKELL